MARTDPLASTSLKSVSLAPSSQAIIIISYRVWQSARSMQAMGGYRHGWNVLSMLLHLDKYCTFRTRFPIHLCYTRPLSTSSRMLTVFKPCSTCSSLNKKSGSSHPEQETEYFYPDVLEAMQQIKCDEVKQDFTNSPDDDNDLEHTSQVWMLSQTLINEKDERSMSVPLSFIPAEINNTAELVHCQACAYGRRHAPSGAGTQTNAQRPYFSTWPRSQWNVRHFSSIPLSSMNQSSPYDILHVPRTATRQEIKANYYGLVKKLHPDTNHSASISKQEKDSRVEKFRIVVKAYELLMDEKRRLMYDRYGVGWGSGHTAVPSSGRHSRSASFGPRSDDDWEHWYMWREVVRRSRYQRDASWQRMAQNPYHEHQFYGFAFTSAEDAKRQQEAAPWNQKVFIFIFLMGCVLSAIQILGVRAYGTRDSTISIQHSSKAAQNLEDARRAARSEEGLQRQRLMLERAREFKHLRSGESPEALPTPA